MNKCPACNEIRFKTCKLCEQKPNSFHDFRDYPVLPKYHSSWHNEVIYDESGAVIYKRNYQ